MKEAVPIFRVYHRLHHLFMQCVSKLITNSPAHPGQAGLLVCLLDSGSLSQSELCRNLKVSAAAVAVSLRRLEKQGVISRRQNPDDLREKLLCLTPLGEKNAVEIRNAVIQVQRKAIEGLSSEELEYLSDLLLRIADNLIAFKNPLSEETVAHKEQGE